MGCGLCGDCCCAPPICCWSRRRGRHCCCCCSAAGCCWLWSSPAAPPSHTNTPECSSRRSSVGASRGADTPRLPTIPPALPPLLLPRLWPAAVPLAPEAPGPAALVPLLLPLLLLLRRAADRMATAAAAGAGAWSSSTQTLHAGVGHIYTAAGSSFRLGCRMQCHSVSSVAARSTQGVLIGSLCRLAMVDECTYPHRALVCTQLLRQHSTAQSHRVC